MYHSCHQVILKNGFPEENGFSLQGLLALHPLEISPNLASIDSLPLKFISILFLFVPRSY